MDRDVHDINSIRSWFVSRMDEVFVAADGSFLFLDANERAKILFPKLNGLEAGDPLPEEVRPLFTAKEEHVRLKNRYFEKKIFKAGGSRDFICLTLYDRTDEKELKKDLAKAREDAEQTNITKSVFMSNMSHELRTPMNAIIGTADILLRENMSPEVRGYINNIKGSADSLLATVNDMLDISKIEDGTLRIVEDSYEPMSLFDDLSIMFLKKLDDKPVELLYMLDPEIPSKLYGDMRRIRQIIVNMVNNAIEFTDSGFICLSVDIDEMGDDYCILSFSVTDSGQGIKDEDKGDLFCPFQKAGLKQRSEREGAGFGLSICKQLVKLMGGTIGVESTLGSGSRFYFTLTQGIVNPKPAAVIKDREKHKGIYYLFDDGYLEENIIRLAEQYGIPAVDYNRDRFREGKEEASGNLIFTDNTELLNEEDEKLLNERGVKICVLQNPVQKDYSTEGKLVVNKPVYSLNFCQILNDETDSANDRHGIMRFTAPDARILVVDDNEMNIQVARGLLAPFKMQIDSAEDGKAGIECVLGNSYDIIFMDHMMPGMDGVEALERIRDMQNGRYAEVPIVALSANATAEAEEMFKKKGFSDFVAKPIRIKELLKCIRKWLPADKLMPVEISDKEAGVQEEETEDAASADDSVVIPDEIEGLSVKEGISYCGSPALFLKCMVIFYKIIDKKTHVISKCLEDGLIRDFTIEVHALKNSARMIGAGKLSEDFKELEQMGNDGDLDGIMAKTPEVLNLYQSYKAVIKPFAEKENESSEIPGRDEIIDKLDRIIEAIDDFDMDGADEAMGMLRKYALPGELSDKIIELDALVSDFAMEDVVSLANEIKEECFKLM